MSSAQVHAQGDPLPTDQSTELRDLMAASSTADPPYDIIRRSITGYVLALRNANAAPEQVLASIKYMLRDDDGPTAALDARRAMVVRWFIEEYYRPGRARRAG